MNLLTLALSIQPRQTVSYQKLLSQAENDIGEFIPTYETAVDLIGSFQPISQNLYKQNGFDLNKHYFVFYTTTDMGEIDRDSSGDLLEYVNDTYQVLDKNDWFNFDGWVGVTCVRQ